MKYFSLTHLAAGLNVDVSMISHIVDQLKSMGYIKEEVMGTACDSDCKKCAGCPSFGNIRPPKSLTITDKGYRALTGGTSRSL